VSRPTQGSQRFLPVRGYHPLWRAFPDASGSYAETTGLFRFRSPLLTESRLMSFPPGTEMFQFPGFACPCGHTLSSGFPHSEICGSTGARPSPQLIAACHVLHRLCMPRHPPNALLSRLIAFSETRNQRSEARCQRPEGSHVRCLQSVSGVNSLAKTCSALITKARPSMLARSERPVFVGRSQPPAVSDQMPESMTPPRI
jgi:hypothetical protein